MTKPVEQGEGRFGVTKPVEQGGGNELAALLGEPLYGEVIARAGGAALLIDDGRLIPKHRFDCVNVSRKEHKRKAQLLEAENERLRDQLAALRQAAGSVEALVRENAVLKAVSQSKCRNPAALRALLDDGAPLETLDACLNRQIKRLKKTDPYLFEQALTYRLVPCRERPKKEDS